VRGGREEKGTEKKAAQTASVKEGRVASNGVNGLRGRKRGSVCNGKKSWSKGDAPSLSGEKERYYESFPEPPKKCPV